MFILLELDPKQICFMMNKHKEASEKVIEVVEYESNSSTEPTGVTYLRTYFDNITPANVITQNYNTTITCPPLKAVGYVFGGWATSVQNATNKIVARATNSTFTLGAAGETYFAIWTENVSPTTKFTDLETVFGRKGTAQISISEYRAESGQTTANSRINFVTNFKGKGLAPP